MVSGHGYTSARGMLIADCATEEDIGTGKALSGYPAQVLQTLAKDNNVNFDEFYKTCLIKERGNLKDYKENVSLLSDDYKNILAEEIRSVQPNLIIPIGELAFNFVSGHSGIRKFRGSVLPLRPDILHSKTVRVLPILGSNPYLNEDYKLRFITRLDFSKVAKALYQEGPIEEIGRIWIARSVASLRAFFQRSYPNAKFVVFDIETYGNIPTCISFCFDGNESVCIPFLDRKIDPAERALLLMEVAKMLASPIGKVNQNIKFDWKGLEKYGFKVNNVIGDTALSASLLYCEFPKNLGFLTSLYTDMPYFKDEGKGFDPAIHDPDRFYIYNAKDSLSTFKICEEQNKERVELGVQGVYEKLMQVMPIYKRLEETGIRIDEEQRRRLLAKYESKFEIQKYKLSRLAGKEINPLSPQQVWKLVFEELGFKRIQGVKSTSAGRESTDDESLELLAWGGKCTAINGNDILKSITNCRKLHKITEFIQTRRHPDGRMRCDYNLGGTETGRTSCGGTTDYLLYIKKGRVTSSDIGHSFQNIGKHGFEMDGEELGKDLRSMFVPDIGYSFVECDLSQAEARVDAILARDFDILDVFDGPIGIHKLTGSWLYNCDPSEISKKVLVDGKNRYHEAKTARHAGERNMKAKRLMMMIHRTMPECEHILKVFHAKQPNIREVFHKEIREHVQRNHCLIAPNGRRRDFYGRFDENQINEGISQLPQAIVTDQLKFSLIPTMAACPWAIPQVEAHDGFLASVPKGKEMEYAETFKSNIEGMLIDFRTCSLSRDYLLKIPCEVSVSEGSWMDLEEVKI